MRRANGSRLPASKHLRVTGLWRADQVFVAEPLAVHAANHRAHLVDGVERALVVAARELVDVAVKVLHGQLVVSALIPALQHRPKRLNAVRVGLAVHVLAYAVLDRLPQAGQAIVGAGFVRVDGRVGVRVVDHESL